MHSKIVVFFAAFGVALAAVGLAKHEPKPQKFSHIEGCYVGVLDEMIPIGESRPSTQQCMEYRCGPEWVQYVSCGAIGVLPSQELVQDLDKPYPECCPRVREITSTNTTAVGHDDD